MSSKTYDKIVKVVHQIAREWFLNHLPLVNETTLVVELAKKFHYLLRVFICVCQRKKLRVNVETSRLIVVG